MVHKQQTPHKPLELQGPDAKAASQPVHQWETHKQARRQTLPLLASPWLTMIAVHSQWAPEGTQPRQAEGGPAPSEGPALQRRKDEAVGI